MGPTQTGSGSRLGVSSEEWQERMVKAADCGSIAYGGRERNGGGALKERERKNLVGKQRIVGAGQ
jgi:hypothetical protein